MIQEILRARKKGRKNEIKKMSVRKKTKERRKERRI